mgnify:FL=1
MDKECCDNNKSLEILTPYPKKRNKIERFLDRHNHLMEFMRTLLGIATVTLQLIILYRLSN